MSRSIIAASVQFTIALGDPGTNIDAVDRAITRLAERGVQLVVLPEMWSTGFAYRQLNELASQTEDTVAWLCEISGRFGMTIVGSLPEPHGGKVYNTAYVVDRGGVVGTYRKIHLFSLMQEDRSFDAGNRWLVADTSVGRLGVFICYDLRFPELSRRLALEGAEILVVPGEWPKPREEHWRTLLRARAIENQCFLVAANTCGVVGKLDFFGMSMIVNPKGEVLAEAGYDPAEIVATLDYSEMEAWRSQIPCFADRRPELY